jgi:hypothetical protein
MNAPAPVMNALPSERSTFVTVLAFILLAFGAMSVFSGLTQVFFFDSLADLSPETLPGAATATVDPEFAEAASNVGRNFAIMGVVISGFFTYAAFALLRRRNWARVLYIVLFAIGIVANILFLAIFGLGLGAFVNLAGPAFQAVFWIAAVFAIALAVLQGWIIKRLRSAPVKSEFYAASLGTE